MAIKALEQQPCEDCISREAVKKLKKYRLNYDTNSTIPKTGIFVKIADIEELPPVTPQPKMGQWIYTGDYITDGMLKCSECGFEHDVSERFSYCPNCGKKMEVKKDFENAIDELWECEQNCLVQTQIGVLLTYKRLIHNLPDGYPLPFTERGKR